MMRSSVLFGMDKPILGRDLEKSHYLDRELERGARIGTWSLELGLELEAWIGVWNLELGLELGL